MHPDILKAIMDERGREARGETLPRFLRGRTW
jgi:hypothetical protein